MVGRPRDAARRPANTKTQPRMNQGPNTDNHEIHEPHENEDQKTGEPRMNAN